MAVCAAVGSGCVVEAYYSNRCAAYLSTQDDAHLPKALADAEACIRTKPEWAKGHARKGSVLWRQRDYKGAVAAYQLAISHSPGLWVYVVVYVGVDYGYPPLPNCCLCPTHARLVA